MFNCAINNELWRKNGDISSAEIINILTLSVENSVKLIVLFFNIPSKNYAHLGFRVFFFLDQE